MSSTTPSKKQIAARLARKSYLSCTKRKRTLMKSYYTLYHWNHNYFRTNTEFQIII